MNSLVLMCNEENIRYEDALYTAYGLEQPSGTGVNCVDVRRYALPLPEEKEKQLIHAYPPLGKKGQMTKFYQSIAQMVTRDYKIATVLAENNVRSTVRYLSNDHRMDDDTSEVYLSTGKLTPLSEIGLRPDITIGFVIDTARRLLAICKDLDKLGITHRNINPHCIFLDENNRLFLGGFGCAAIRGEDKKPIPIPVIYDCHVAPDVKEGKTGNIASDMYSIASIMAHYFAGVDINEDKNADISPLIPATIQEAILLGCSMDVDKVDEFRAKLNRAYKEGRALYWNIPVSVLYTKRLGVAPEEPEKKEAKPKREKRQKKQKEQKASDASEVDADDKKSDKFGKVASFAFGVLLMLLVLIAIVNIFGITPDIL